MSCKGTFILDFSTKNLPIILFLVSLWSAWKKIWLWLYLKYLKDITWRPDRCVWLEEWLFVLERRLRVADLGVGGRLLVALRLEGGIFEHLSFVIEWYVQLKINKRLQVEAGERTKYSHNIKSVEDKQVPAFSFCQWLLRSTLTWGN